MKLVRSLMTAALLVAGTAGIAAAEYPERPISLIVPWGAGGGTDATGRILAQLMEEKLGQPINVVNRTGGGSVIGHTAIAEAEPDGYTLGIITTELSMFQWLGQSDISYKDYTLIGLYNADPSTVIVRADGPYETMDDLVEALKTDAANIRAGGANQGGLNHLAYSSLLQELAPDAEAFWVPTEGAAPALQLLSSGAIDLVVVQLAEAQALIEAGELRPLAVLGEARNPDFPDVPTIVETTGIDFTIAGWRGLAGPKGMSEDIVAKLSEAMAEVVPSDAFKEFMASRNYGVVYAGGKDFEAYLEKRDRVFGEAMKAAGLVKE